MDVSSDKQNRRWARENPHVGTGPVPAEPCVSPEYFELERERVFRRVWLNVGRVEAIPKPGDYFVRDLDVCDTSILVVHGTDGVIRSFHNVCSHRSNQLVPDKKGCRRAFTCNFHGWSFNTQGELAGIFDEENFFDLDKSKLGLTSVATEVWQGFIFVHLGEPRETLAEYLGGVGEQLGDANFDERVLAHTYEVTEAANWKVALDAQNEAYHLPIQHRYSFPGIFVLKDDRYLRLSGVKLYNHHSVWSTTYSTQAQATPSGALINEVDTAATSRRLPMLGDFDFFTIFPNFCILQLRGLSDDYYATYNFWPHGVDSCTWEINFYFPPLENAGQQLSRDYLIHRICDVLEEDALAHETLQIGLRSRANSNLHFQDDEIQIRYFHEVLENHVGFYNGQ